NTDIVETQFNRSSPLEKIDFYIKYKNYQKAIDMIGLLNLSGIKNELLQAELYYRNGHSAAGQKLINGLFRSYPEDFQLRNSVGFFYLRRLNRINEALSSFKGSLNINENQPGIKKLVDYLVGEIARISRYVM
ncbi:MAG: hypothetical protein KAT17_10155, partial [Candidatus Aminicenantes bacterium]|nr:hypothetical protein [Candidatus Aminicenantes bacterium]